MEHYDAPFVPSCTEKHGLPEKHVSDDSDVEKQLKRDSSGWRTMPCTDRDEHHIRRAPDPPAEYEGVSSLKHE